MQKRRNQKIKITKAYASHMPSILNSTKLNLTQLNFTQLFA